MPRLSIITCAAKAAERCNAGSGPLIVMLLLVGGLILSGVPRSSNNEAMHEAAANGDLASLHELIRQGADPNAQDGLGYTPLAWAALMGRIDMVEMLVAGGAAVDLPHPELGSPLMLALANGQAEVARVLLNRGADIHFRCAGWDPLGSAARSNSVECLELAMQAGARLQVDGRRCGLLTLALDHSDTRLLKRLLDAGVDPNLPDTDGSTPLINAIECGHMESARLLLLHGADPYRAGADGRTPHAVAQWLSFRKLLALLTFDSAQAAHWSANPEFRP
jgi:uncharacterized protein